MGEQLARRPFGIGLGGEIADQLAVRRLGHRQPLGAAVGEQVAPVRRVAAGRAGEAPRGGLAGGDPHGCTGMGLIFGVWGLLSREGGRRRSRPARRRLCRVTRYPRYRRPRPSPRHDGESWSPVRSSAKTVGLGSPPAGFHPLEQIRPSHPRTTDRDSAAAAGHCRHACAARRASSRAASAFICRNDHLGRGARREHRIQDRGVDHARLMVPRSGAGGAGRRCKRASRHLAVPRLRMPPRYPARRARARSASAPTPRIPAKLPAGSRLAPVCLFLLCSHRKFPTLQARTESCATGLAAIRLVHAPIRGRAGKCPMKEIDAYLA